MFLNAFFYVFSVDVDVHVCVYVCVCVCVSVSFLFVCLESRLCLCSVYFCIFVLVSVWVHCPLSSYFIFVCVYVCAVKVQAMA